MVPGYHTLALTKKNAWKPKQRPKGGTGYARHVFCALRMPSIYESLRVTYNIKCYKFPSVETIHGWHDLYTLTATSIYLGD